MVNVSLHCTYRKRWPCQWCIPSARAFVSQSRGLSDDILDALPAVLLSFETMTCWECVEREVDIIFFSVVRIRLGKTVVTSLIKKAQ